MEQDFINDPVAATKKWGKEALAGIQEKVD